MTLNLYCIMQYWLCVSFSALSLLVGCRKRIWPVKNLQIPLYQRHILQRVLHRANNRDFTCYYCDPDTLAENANCHLFHHSCYQAHCLSHLYVAKPWPPGAMWLRTHGHDFELLTIKYEFNKRNFIVRSLFNYM